MRFFFITLTLIVFVQCSEQPEHVIASKWANGTTKKEVVLLAGDSTVQTFYSSGSIEKIQLYTKGEKSGEWTSYYEDGTRWSEHHYVKGIQVGAYKTWHPNGEPFIDGLYNDQGKTVGTWTIKDEEGNILQSVAGETLNP